MNYRVSSLLANKAYTDDDLETIDIDLTDPISEILIQADPHTDNANEGPGAHAISVLEKVEIIDGSDVLLSLTGYQLHALDIYNRDRQRNPWYQYLDDNTIDMPVGINFGRWLWDEVLAFDATKFSNPQLKITIDESGYGGSFDQVNLQVDAMIFDEKKVTPTGFLMAKEFKEYTLGDATHEYTVMPTDHPYRKMYIQALLEGYEPNQQIDTIKLAEDHDKKIPFNAIDMDTLFRGIAYTHPPVVDHIYQYCKASATEGFCTPTTRVAGAGNVWQAATSTEPVIFYDGDGGRFHVIKSTGGAPINLIVEGYLPHGVFEIPFGLPNVIEDWYDVTDIKSLQLDILATDANNSVPCKVVLEQYRPY